MKSEWFSDLFFAPSNRGDTPFCSVECRYYQMEMDQVSVRISTKPVKERAAINGQRHRRNETSASESGNVTIAANKPVAS